MKKILIVVDYYLPGYRAGGPVQSITNLTEWLGDQFQFFIFTRDRDVGDGESYPGVSVNDWNIVGDTKVFYCRPFSFHYGKLRQVITDVDPDIIYLNSFFSTICGQVFLARSLGVLRNRKVVVAPRGELGAGALSLKATKKKLYSSFFKDILRFGRRVKWQATGENELADIKGFFGGGIDVHFAPNLPRRLLGEVSISREKHSGAARFVFCSRITRKKNIAWLIRLLPKLRAESITLDLIGPNRDAEYWRECEESVADLPDHIRVRFLGGISPMLVSKELEQHHFFVLPTLNENFGHAILEGFAAGCPVIVSDQTPWRELAEKEAGWDLPLEEDLWREKLQWAIDCEQPEFDRFSKGAYKLARDYQRNPPVEASERLFST